MESSWVLGFQRYGTDLCKDCVSWSKKNTLVSDAFKVRVRAFGFPMIPVAIASRHRSVCGPGALHSVSPRNQLIPEGDEAQPNPSVLIAAPTLSPDGGPQHGTNQSLGEFLEHSEVQALYIV